MPEVSEAHVVEIASHGKDFASDRLQSEIFIF